MSIPWEEAFGKRWRVVRADEVPVGALFLWPSRRWAGGFGYDGTLFRRTHEGTEPAADYGAVADRQMIRVRYDRAIGDTPAGTAGLIDAGDDVDVSVDLDSPSVAR